MEGWIVFMCVCVHMCVWVYQRVSAEAKERKGMSAVYVYMCVFWQTSIVAGTLITAGVDRGRESLPITG